MLAATGSVLFVLSAGVTLAVLPPLARRAHAMGLVALPGGRRHHAQATPVVGGVAVLLGVALPALGGLGLALLAGSGSGLLPEELARHLPGIRNRAPQLLGILCGSAAMLVLGHMDDRRELPAGLRLGIQALAALLLVGLDVRVTVFLPHPLLQAAATVVFVTFVTNAVNFIDNMDGQMAGVVGAGALHLTCLAVATGQLFMAAILVCLAGALAGFLPFNFPRARVFSGDAGSLATGFLLGALAVAFTYQENGNSLLPVLVPALVLGVPLADGVVVTGSRLARGVHPFTAGRDHLAHRLAARGLSARGAVLVLWAAAFLLGMPALLLARVPAVVVAAVWGPALAVAGGLCVLGVRRRP